MALPTSRFVTHHHQQSKPPTHLIGTPRPLSNYQPKQPKSTTTTVDGKSSTPAVSHARAHNDFGTNLWVRQGAVEHRHPTAGRGLFAGLQDMKKYNVDHGWAKRNVDASEGLGGWLWNKVFGGNYKPYE